MVNTEELTDAVEYRAQSARCHINWCCYNWVQLYLR